MSVTVTLLVVTPHQVVLNDAFDNASEAEIVQQAIDDAKYQFPNAVEFNEVEVTRPLDS